MPVTFKHTVMIHRHHGKAHKTLHSHCYLCLTFSPFAQSVSHACSNLTIVRISVWTMTQWKTQLSQVPGKRKAQWDQNPYLFMDFVAHTLLSAFCCGLCQQKINPQCLAVSGSAQNPSPSSNLCTIFNNLHRKQWKYLCAWHWWSIKPFILFLKLEIQFSPFISWQDEKKKRWQKAIYLYFTGIFRSIQERHFALHIFRFLDDL